MTRDEAGTQCNGILTKKSDPHDLSYTLLLPMILGFMVRTCTCWRLLSQHQHASLLNQLMLLLLLLHALVGHQPSVAAPGTAAISRPHHLAARPRTGCGRCCWLRQMRCTVQGGSSR
jgi:hypothetical protein